MKYIPNNQATRQAMLDAMGAGSVEKLFSTIPQDLQLKRPLAVPPAQGEFDLLNQLKKMAGQNRPDKLTFMGAGAYRRYIPSAVEALASRSEFLTCYTPYQPEVSQGTLQVMFEFQSLLSKLTGMEVANGSMYEGASALAEAVLMASRINPKKKRVLYSEGIHPEYLATTRTYLAHLDLELVPVKLEASGRTDLTHLEAELKKDALCSLLQVVNFFGVIEDQASHGQLCVQAGALNIAVLPELSALGLIAPPGQFGADIVVGEGQSLGLPLSYGGPYLGVFASRMKHVRKMPGRLAGLTKDAEGKRAFCLTLSTREQHIRREKATSNICSNQMLCALWVTCYLALLGHEGITRLAKLNFDKAQYAKQVLTSLPGVKARYSATSYNEFVLELPQPADQVVQALDKKGILPGVALSRFNHQDKKGLLVCVTEVNSKEQIDRLVQSLKEQL